MATLTTPVSSPSCLVLACVAVAGLVMVTSGQASAGRLIATEAFPLPQGFHEVQWDTVPREPFSFVAARNQDPNQLGEITAIFTWENATQSWRSFRPGVPAMINTLHQLQNERGLLVRGRTNRRCPGAASSADERDVLADHLHALSMLFRLSEAITAQSEKVLPILQTFIDGTATGTRAGQRLIDLAYNTWEWGSALLAMDGFGETVAASCTEGDRALAGGGIASVRLGAPEIEAGDKPRVSQCADRGGSE